MTEMDDRELAAALMRQARPVEAGTFEAAREQVEGLLAPGIAAHFHLTAPEARVEATRILARFESLSVERGRETGRHEAELAAPSPEPCRTTQHCAYHGWCHRCDPTFSTLMSGVNVVIQRVSQDEQTWGPLYAQIGEDLHDSLTVRSAVRLAEAEQARRQLELEVSELRHRLAELEE